MRLMKESWTFYSVGMAIIVLRLYVRARTIMHCTCIRVSTIRSVRDANDARRPSAMHGLASFTSPIFKQMTTL